MTTKVPARQTISLPFSEQYVGPLQAIISAGAVTLAHGLSNPPYNIIGVLECIVADASFAVGDMVVVPLVDQFERSSGSAARSVGQVVWVDATNINIRYGSYTNVFSVINPTTGAHTQLANASWQLEVRAQA